MEVSIRVYPRSSVVLWILGWIQSDRSDEEVPQSSEAQMAELDVSILRQIDADEHGFLILAPRLSGIRVIEDPLPFEAGAFEIQNEADGMAGDLEVVEHLPEFVIGDSVDHFGVHHYEAVCNEVRDVFADSHRLVENVVASLLFPRDSTQPEFNAERVFVRFFRQTVAKRVQDLECTTDDLTSLLFESQSKSIRS